MTYVAVAVALVVFGCLALFSIGFPFALTGLLMLALFRSRGRREVIVPALAWPWAFTLGYVLVAPLGCTTSVTATSIAAAPVETAAASTRCDALFLTYAGGASYDPAILPASSWASSSAPASPWGCGRSLRARPAASTPAQ